MGPTVKRWSKQVRCLLFWIMLILTIVYFLLQMLLSYITHSLTLTIDSYLVFYNIIALCSSIATLKGKDKVDRYGDRNSDSSCSEDKFITKIDESKKTHANEYTYPTSKKRLDNTFGWARIDVLLMLIACVFLFTLCFAVIMEAVKKLLHISHGHEMHQPIFIFYIGLCGLFLNLLHYLLIAASTGNISANHTNLKEIMHEKRSDEKCYHNLCAIARDSVGKIFVMISGVFVYSTDEDVGKYIDSVTAILSASIVLILSYPHMKQSCMILLQTIPDHVNIESLSKTLLQTFPGIINVHHLHVWQFTPNFTFCTVHIIFLDQQIYSSIKKELVIFFQQRGINHVTLQPEFLRNTPDGDGIVVYESDQCLVECSDAECNNAHCHSAEKLVSVDLTKNNTLNESKKCESDNKSGDTSCGLTVVTYV